MALTNLLTLYLMVLSVWISSAMELNTVSSPLNYQALKCFACTSYVPDCKTTVNDTQNGVPHVGCKTKCFLRQGYEKELPLYRGCLDDFMSVPYLDTDYTGCQKQTWNGVERIWCLCDSDMCNGESMATIGKLNPDSLLDSHDLIHLPRDNGDPYVPAATPSVDYDSYVTSAGFNQGYNDLDPYPQPFDLDNTQYNLDGLYADETLPEYKDVEEYAKHIDIPHPPNEGDLAKALDDQKKKQESYSDDGIDRPYFPDSKKIYTDIEQVHFGDSNDIFVNTPQTHKQIEINQPVQQRKFDPYADRNAYYGAYRPYENAFIQQPYYPYGRAKEDDYVKYGQHGRKRTEHANTNRYRASPQHRQAAPAPAHGGLNNRDKFTYHQPTTYAAYPEVIVSTTASPDKVLCTHTGFIPNPEDCSTFLACIMDSNVGKPVMHRMRCPDGLFWDNIMRVCVATSSTCKENKTPYDYANNQYGDDNSHKNI